MSIHNLIDIISGKDFLDVFIQASEFLAGGHITALGDQYFVIFIIKRDRIVRAVANAFIAFDRELI